MSRVIESDSFALPVVRETTQLSIGIESLRSSSATIMATARRRARLMESVFDDDDIYAWFEPGGEGSLYCAFATVPGYLLGENVRNWLRETRQARNFVYCERMGSQRAVVLVIDGHVVKDALVGGYELNVELRYALGRLDKAAPGAAHYVFLHGVDVQDLQLADRSRAISLENSVLDWMEDAPGPLPELNPTNRAIGVIDVVAKRLRQLRIVRTIGLTVGSVLIAALGVYWWQNRPPPPPPDGEPPPPPTEVINARYSALLRTPDPGKLIPAIHRAYRLFVGDPVLGELLDVSKLQWTSAGGRLTIETSLPADVAQGPRNEPPDALLEQIRQRAAMHEWGVEFTGIDARFSLPVVAASRVDELRLPQLSAEGNPWHEKRLGADLEVLGTVTIGPGPRNQVYRGFSTILELRALEWAAGDTAAWIANRLAGGPLVLDSVVLESGSGALMDGELRFTTLWCEPAPADASRRRCAFENA